MFGCHEVTIGWFGKERADYITFDTKGVWRCYEIKVSKADFYSKANNTFVGHYNYYVMPDDLYEEISAEITPNIGVHNGVSILRPAKKVPLGQDEMLLLKRFCRSLSRAYHRRALMKEPDALERAEKILGEARKIKSDMLDTLSRFKNENYSLRSFIRKRGLNQDYLDYQDLNEGNVLWNQ